jgi:hypothetical protein
MEGSQAQGMARIVDPGRVSVFVRPVIRCFAGAMRTI